MTTMTEYKPTIILVLLIKLCRLIRLNSKLGTINTLESLKLQYNFPKLLMSTNSFLIYKHFM